MDAREQFILVLIEQNTKLLQEIEFLKSQLSKHKCSAPLNIFVPEKPKKKKINVSPEGHVAHVASGKRLAAYNAAKKAQLQEMIAAAQLEGDW